MTDIEKKQYQDFVATLSDSDKQLINGNYYFYVVDLKNIGGLVMPVILKMEYVDRHE